MNEGAEAVRLRFKLREAFPPDKPLSVALLRLMAAVNDVGYVQKLILVALEQPPHDSEANRLIQEGELVYLSRMLVGHLHEAGKAFRELDEHHSADLGALIATNEKAQVEVAKLRAVYRDPSPAGVTKALLEGVRTPWAFHYKHARFKEALERHPEDATIIISEYAGASRYTVTDDFAKLYILDKVGGEEAFDRLVGEAINLAGTLGRAVDHLLGVVFEGREDTLLLEETTESVAVPAEIMRFRDKR